MHLEHHPRRVLDAHREELLKDEHDEFHRRVIVVEHQHLVVRRLLGLRARTRRNAGLDVVESVAVRGIGHHHPAHTHHSLKYGKLANTRKAAVVAPIKKMAAAPGVERPPTPLPRLRRGEGQATRLLIRSALAVARFESGWNASPASLTNDSVSFELSATARSNVARAYSLCSCRYSVGDLASASERIASAVCSTPSRLVATTSWPIERAPSDATRLASTIASTLARARSASSSATFWLRLTSSWLRSFASANSDWNGANAGTASKPLKKLLLVTVSILSWAAAAFLRVAVRTLRAVALVRRAVAFRAVF